MNSKNVSRWDLPGWKYEPKYSPRTLVGEWFQERQKFIRGSLSLYTTNILSYTESNAKGETVKQIGGNNRYNQENGKKMKFVLDHDLKDKLSKYNLEYSHPFVMKSCYYRPRKWDRNACRWVFEKMDLPNSTKEGTLHDMIKKMKSDFQKTNQTKMTAKSTISSNVASKKEDVRTPRFLYRHNRENTTLIDQNIQCNIFHQ